MAWDQKEITAYLVDVDTGDYLTSLALVAIGVVLGWISHFVFTAALRLIGSLVKGLLS